jgi:PII-like signaling protein
MLTEGAAKKVTIYVGEDAQHHKTPLYEALLAYLVHHGVAGATVTRALAGFGSHRVIHTPKMEALAEHLPLKIEFIESPARVDELLPALCDMVSDGLIEVQDTCLVKVANRSKEQR